MSIIFSGHLKAASFDSPTLNGLTRSPVRRLEGMADLILRAHETGCTGATLNGEA